MANCCAACSRAPAGSSVETRPLSGEGSFAQEIGESLARVNQELDHAEQSARELASGKGDLVETMIALGRADVSLRMVVTLRNRALESYQEIMRLQV